MQLKQKIYRLKNGMEVLFLKRPEKYTVGFSFLINAGQIYENKKNSGISHFLEHLLFDGTEMYPTEELLRKRTQELGFAINAHTRHDRIEIDGVFPIEELRNSLNVLKEMVYKSLLLPGAVKKEKNVILDEERLRGDDNYIQLWNLVFKTRFKDNNPLTFPIEGSKESIMAIEQEQINRFYETHFNAANTKLVIAANLNRKKLYSEIEEAFNNLPKAIKSIPAKISNKDMTGFRLKIINNNTKQIYFAISFPTYAGFDLKNSWENGFLLELLEEKLNQRLRIDQGLVYHLSCSSYRPVENVAIAYIQIACDPDSFKEIVNIIFEEIKIIKKGVLDLQTFERLRAVSNRTLPMNFDYLSGAMEWCIDSLFYTDKVYFPEEVINARNQIIPEDLKEKAKDIFDFQKMNFAAIGTIDKKEIEKIVKENL